MDDETRKPGPMHAHNTNRLSHIARRTSAALALLALTAVWGCHRPARPDTVTAAAIGGGDDLTDVWNSTLSVLRKFDFQPDRQDRAAGVITTHPTTSMQWHEFWRQDVATAHDLLSASMHTIQRRVTVRFKRDADWTVEVQVDVYRLAMPETQITSASSVMHGFSGALPTTEGKMIEPGQSPKYWVNLGRDGVLEGRILRRILAYADSIEWVDDAS